MRHVEISLRAETREPILATLDAKSVDYTVVPATDESEYAAVVSFTLPANAVETVLDDLQAAGLGEDDHTVVVTAETVISKPFGALKSEYTGDVLSDERLARHELYANSDSLIPTLPVYVTMTVLSAIVATAGLLLDSAAVVVGSMVIAPLIGPALAASVGTVLNENHLFWKGITYQAVGVVLAIVGATAFAWLARTMALVPPGIDVVAIDEVSERLLPDLLSLFIAFGAGIAGVLSLATGISSALVGVMIAAALIPPAAAAGIAVAWGIPDAATGSLILVFVNLLAINVTGLFTLWIMGYRPHVWTETRTARWKVRRNVVAFTIAILLLSTFLIGVTWASYERATLESEIEAETESVLEEPAYQNVSVVEVELFLEEGVPFEPATVLKEGTGLERPDTVVITVEQPIGASNPELSGTLSDRIDERTGYEMTVHVRFIEYDAR
ncbi:TIGR00341 family protein [Natrialba swarupiae]|uniref:TIGR00341 family protein n=1 Tax=Natrialba swarupiae TaxID=2448032 RepID=A0A5D5AWI5_9EURY|nr:TIGR00341 family protein [Natrialba swarupiae]TYT63391.1 TIGR00341 family protein [Natrialba swarupiae]